jgi:hypothetical protein
MFDSGHWMLDAGKRFQVSGMGLKDQGLKKRLNVQVVELGEELLVAGVGFSIQ